MSGIYRQFLVLAMLPLLIADAGAQLPTTASRFTLVNPAGQQITLTMPASGVSNYSMTLPAAAGGMGSLLYASNIGGVLGWIAPGTTGQVLAFNALGIPSWVDITTLLPGSGTVTSVGLSMPSIFSVSSSPITTSGTFGVSLNSQTANTVFAGPASGFPGTPSFRVLTSSDIPNLSSDYIVNGTSQQSSANFNISGNGQIAGQLRLKGTNVGVTSIQAGAQGLTNITYTLPLAAPTSNGQVLSSTTGGAMSWTNVASGSVTSVGLTMPTGFSVSGSPITSAGTLAVGTTLNGPIRGTGSGFTTGNLNLASEVTGLLSPTYGGVGLNTSTAPTGSLLYTSSGGTWATRTPGSNGSVLTISGGIPVWTSPASSNDWSITGNSGTSASTNFIGTTDAVDFITKTNATERIRITSAGDIGMGTSSPASHIHAVSYGSDAANDFILDAYNSGDATQGAEFRTRRARWVSNALSNITQGDDLGGMKFSGYYQGGFIESAQIDVVADGSPNSTYIPTSLSINTQNSSGNMTSRIYIDGTGEVGVGTSSPDVKLEVVESGDVVAAFDRTSNDGTIISLRQNSNQEGSITVSGSTVSFNGFTGSHYAWTNDQIQKGMIVTMTGANYHLGGRPASEIVYGVRPSTIENDPNVLGAYLGLEETSLVADSTNPHLIMAVGNGELWVTDDAGDIAIGDYLVTSAYPGHAMKDDGRFERANIIARAAEPVGWSNIPGGVTGKKRAKISVFFESFVRESAVTLQRNIDALEQRMQLMQAQINELIKKVQ